MGSSTRRGVLIAYVVWVSLVAVVVYNLMRVQRADMPIDGLLSVHNDFPDPGVTRRFAILATNGNDNGVFSDFPEGVISHRGIKIKITHRVIDSPKGDRVCDIMRSTAEEEAARQFVLAIVPMSCLPRYRGAIQGIGIDDSEPSLVITSKNIAYWRVHNIEEKIPAAGVRNLLNHVFVEENGNVDYSRNNENYNDNNDTDNDNKHYSFSPAAPVSLMLSLVVSDPELDNVSWNAREIDETYIQPFLKSFHGAVEVTVMSQVIPRAGSPPGISRGNQKKKEPQEENEDKEREESYISEKKLGSFVNDAAWGLDGAAASHRETPIHLVAYVPERNQRPLKIRHKKGKKEKSDTKNTSDGFVIPGWGSVVIVNEPESDLEGAIDFIGESFVDDLRELFGIPRHRWFINDDNSKNEMNNNIIPEGATATAKNKRLTSLVLPSPTGVSSWEVDRYLSTRAHFSLSRTKSTLTSLGSMISRMENIVVTDEVASRAIQAMSLVSRCVKSLSQADVLNAFIDARDAQREAAEAFADPALLAVLYFPDENKLAVYFPLGLPIIVPVIKNAMRGWKARRHQKQLEG